MGTTTIVEANAVETRKGVGRETDTTREIETEADSVMHTGAGIAGILTVETTRKTSSPVPQRERHQVLYHEKDCL